MPAISVIVPVYKVEPYLCRCVDSILAQTFTDFELILVDDGSPDNCGAICDEYAQKDSRVHVIHQENGGLSAARNAGIDWAFANSDSQWITFVDSDDLVHPQMLDSLLDAVYKTCSEMAVTLYEKTSGENVFQLNSFTSNATQKGIATAEYFRNYGVNAVVAIAKLYKKEDFLCIRYPVGKIHEDEYTTYKLLFLHEKIAVVDTVMYAYSINPNGIMGSEWSPRHLDAVGAYYEQFEFFEKKGLLDIRDKQIKSFLFVMCMQINSIVHGNKQDYQKYVTILRGEMRKILWRYRKQRIVNIRDDAWILEAAFPRMMQLYWILRNYRNKFGCILKKQ